MDGIPTISTVINNYNYGRFLACAVDSALAQTDVWNEVVVVDDGSSDGSLDVLRAYGDRIRVVSQDNRGQASAINAGVAASRGMLISFLDADDWWEPDHHAAVARVFAERPEVGLVYHRLRPIRDGKQAFRPIPTRVCSGAIGNEMLRSAGRWPFPMTSAITIRRSLWDEVGEIPTVLRISADAWLVGIMPFLTEVAGITEPLGAYRIHNNNWFRYQVDAPMLRRRMAHWETTVRLTNAFLADRGLPGRLDLADHFPYQAAAARLGLPDAPGRLALLCLGLGDRSEANPLRRVREAARAVRGVNGLADRRHTLAAEAVERP